MSAQAKQYEFQAETRQLLDLMINSLYTNKEICLRELISNASDALDRLRFESLTNPELLGQDVRLEIRLEVDRAARTLTISDNGIGMSREEVIENIGTIAKSGTRELRERIKEGGSGTAVAELIGQFGVGFYSSFMVADRVILTTRRAGESTATRWESTGDGRYTLSEAEGQMPGTSVTLVLKPSDPENGIEDFTDKWVLARIVKRYSDFVGYPIIYKDDREQVDRDADGDTPGDGEKRIVVEDKTLNSMKPLWTRPQSQVSESEYAEFYRHISHDWSEPIEVICMKAEGRVEYEALLFIPSKAPYDLYYHASEPGLRLYAKRVMILERCPDLLPRYLRFIKGVVDSADLPLNISRQMLQQDRHITQIRKWLVKKVLERLQEIYRDDYEKYLEFWGQFGRAIKEGISSDYENKDRIVPLLLFHSSHDPGNLTTLEQYVGRMKEDQTEIFYLTGESQNVIENSPHLEAFRENGYEVLYLIDPVDEILVQSLTEYDGKKLKSAGKGKARLGKEEDKERIEKELEEKNEQFAGLLELIQKNLDDHVKQVRLTNRLTTSPVCLVGEEHDYSPQLERLLQKGKGGGPKQRRVMELNPNHQIVIRLKERFQDKGGDADLGQYAEMLLGYALIAEGSELHDPVRFNRLVADLISQSL
jgi:molecular chaperone HtpG